MTSQVPRNALAIWADNQWIYLAIPCLGEPPLIQKYTRDGIGLSKALSWFWPRVYDADEPTLVEAKRHRVPHGMSQEQSALLARIMAK